jgi:hypothetical protein
MPIFFILNINMLVFLLKMWHDEVFTAKVNVVAGAGGTINLEKPPLCAYGQYKSGQGAKAAIKSGN